MDSLTTASRACPLVDWSVATRTMPGEIECGDAHLVAEFPGGVLIAVVDGLGHGVEAALAARIAVATLAAHADAPVVALVERCHARLRGTRGVVMTVASWHRDDGTMTWLGVGNVDGVLLRAHPNARPARESVMLRGGVVGYELPALRPVTHAVAPGDTLVLATDGIQTAFGDALDLDTSPRRIADRVLARYGKNNDDALVLVARCEEIGA